MTDRWRDRLREEQSDGWRRKNIQKVTKIFQKLQKKVANVAIVSKELKIFNKVMNNKLLEKFLPNFFFVNCFKNTTVSVYMFVSA